MTGVQTCALPIWALTVVHRWNVSPIKWGWLQLDWSHLPKLSCLLCHRLVDHRCVGLPLGFLSCSIDLCFCLCVFVFICLCPQATEGQGGPKDRAASGGPAPAASHRGPAPSKGRVSPRATLEAATSSQHISVPSEGTASPEAGAGRGSVPPGGCTDFAPRAGGPPRASLSHSPTGHGDPRRRLPRALFQRHLLGKLVQLALWRLERLSQPPTRLPAPGAPRGADDTATNNHHLLAAGRDPTPSSVSQ